MKMLLANLLIKYTPCSVNIKSMETSLVWTWQGNSWKWVLREPVGMLIMPVDGSTMKFLVRPDPKRKIGEPMKSPKLLPYLKRLETWLPMMKPTNK